MLWETEGVGVAAPTGVATLCSTRRLTDATLCSTRRPLGTTLRSVRLPLTEAAAKPLAMLRWRPDQIVMLKLLRESRNKNLDFFATFLRLGALFRPKKLGSDRNTANYLVFCVSIRNWKALNNC